MTDNSVRLLDRFVKEVLNDHRHVAISEIFRPTFRDHDPITIFGSAPHLPLGRDDIDGLFALSGFLSQPEIDFQFIIEDVFAVSGRIAYRMYGQGSIKIDDAADGRNGNEILPGLPGRFGTLRRLKVSGAEMAVSTRGFHEGTVLGGRYLVMVSRIGIYKVVDNKLAEHWGTAVIS